MVKNLADPTKAQDSKYRQLRLSNEKVRQKLLPCPSALDYMKAIGFAEVSDDDGSRFLRIEMTESVNVVDMRSSLAELTNALEMVEPNASLKTSSNTAPPSRSGSSASLSGEKRSPEGILLRSDSTASTVSNSSSVNSTVKMTEKQRARVLMEEKRKREVEDARAARARTSALIKQDKYVRQNDDNWKSGQSAACVKSGTGISTFRDKYGEN